MHQRIVPRKEPWHTEFRTVKSSEIAYRLNRCVGKKKEQRNRQIHVKNVGSINSAVSVCRLIVKHETGLENIS